jgi:hypothetical protein
LELPHQRILHLRLTTCASVITAFWSSSPA